MIIARFNKNSPQCLIRGERYLRLNLYEMTLTPMTGG